MSDDKPLHRNSTIGRAKHVDALCDEFETECAAGNRPSIESFLLRVDGPNKQPLLIELIAIEMHYRRRSGESIVVAEYQTRFPGLSVSRLEETILHSEKAHSQKTPAADQPTVDTRQGQSAQVESKLVKYFGDYELLDVIARGGMGIVYKARQVSLNRIVALKMILSGEFASRVEVDRFYSEAKAAALLDHPGIVPIYEVGEHEGKHFFSMTYVEGSSLATKLNEGLLEPIQAARTMLEVTQAVHYAHEQGVIHRDLKPSNILLDLQGRPRVTDFGLAKRLTEDTGMTVSGQVLGTPSYMPPEQAAGHINTIGPASDVYALGAVLYSLTTGRPPFQSASGIETLRQVVEKEPVAPRQLNPAIPRDLETIILKCLEKSLPRRYSTAKLLSEELQRFIEGRPILARPIGRVQKAWRWCRREPAVASLLSLSLLLVIGLVVGTGWAYLREAKLLGDLKVAFVVQQRLTNSEIKSKEEAQLQTERAKQQAELAEEAKKAEGKQAEIAREKSRELRRSLYVSDFKQIPGLVSGGNKQRVRELLDRHKPIATSEEDLRSFDWYYWQRKTQPATSAYELGKPIEVMAASEDEKLVAMGCTGGFAYVLDLEKGQLLDEVYQIAEEHWSNIAIIDVGSEHRLYCYGRSGTFRVWDRTSQHVITANPGIQADITSRAPRERWVLPRMPATVSKDGRWMIAADPYIPEPQGESLALWDTKKWTVSAVPSLNAGSATWCMTTDPRGSVVLDQPGEYLRTANAVPIPPLLMTKSGYFKAVFPFELSWPANFPVPDVRGNKEAIPIASEDFGSSIFSIQFSPTGTSFAAAKRDGSITLWVRSSSRDLPEEFLQPLREWNSHQGIARGLSFSPDGKRILSIGDDGRWAVVSTDEDKMIATGKWQSGQATGLRYADWLSAGRIVIGHRNGAIEIWDPWKGRLVDSATFDPNDTGAYCTLPNSGSILVAGKNGTIRRWNIDSSDNWFVPTQAYSSQSELAISSSGQFIAIASAGSEDRRWHLGDMLADRRCLEFVESSPISVRSTQGVSEQITTEHGSVHFVPKTDELIRIDGSTATLWDTSNRTIRKSWKLRELDTTETRSVCYEWLSESDTLMLRKDENLEYSESPICAELSQNGQQLVLVYHRGGYSSSIDGKLVKRVPGGTVFNVFDVASGKKTHRLDVSEIHRVSACGFVDNTKIFVADSSVAPQQTLFAGVWDLKENTLKNGSQKMPQATDRIGQTIKFCKSQNSDSLCSWEVDSHFNSIIRWFDSKTLSIKKEIRVANRVRQLFLHNDEAVYALVQVDSGIAAHPFSLQWMQFDETSDQLRQVCKLEGADEVAIVGSSTQWDRENQRLYLYPLGAHVVRSWSTLNGTEQKPIPIQFGPVKSVALNTTGDAIAVTGERSSFILMDQATVQIKDLGQSGTSVRPTLRPLENATPFAAHIPAMHGWLTSSGFFPSTRDKNATGFTRPEWWRFYSGSGNSVGTGADAGDWEVKILERAPQSTTLVSRDQQVIGQFGFDSKIDIWSLNEPDVPPSSVEAAKSLFRWRKAVKAPFGSKAQIVAMTDTGERIAVGQDLRLAWLDTNAAQWNELKLDSKLRSISWSVDAQSLAIGLNDGSIWIYQCSTGTYEKLGSGQTGDVTSLVWMRDGKTLASGASDGTIAIWDLKQKEIRLLIEAHKGTVSSMQVNDEGSLLVSGGIDGFVQLHRATSQRDDAASYVKLRHINPRIASELVTATSQQLHEQSTLDWLVARKARHTLHFYGAGVNGYGVAAHDRQQIGIHRIDFSNDGSIRDADIERVSGLSGLYFLSIAGTSVTSAGLSKVRGLEQLRSLDLRHVALGGHDIATMGINSRLLVLKLNDTNLTDTQLASIVKACPRIEELELTNNNISNTGIATINRLRELKSLKLAGNNIDGGAIDSLQKFSRLNELDLSDTKLDGEKLFGGLQSLHDLTLLSIDGLNCSEKAIELLAADLSLGPAPQQADFKTIQEFRNAELSYAQAKLPKFWPKLRQIDMRRTTINLEGLVKILASRPLLKTYSDIDTPGASPELVALLKMQPMEGIEKVGISGEEKPLADALSMLQANAHVTSIQWPKKRDDGMEQLELLQSFPELNEVRVGYGVLDPKVHFPLLARLPNVTSLTLAKHNSLAQISELKQLEHLRLVDGDIGEKGFQQLSKLPKLTSMEIRDLSSLSFANFASLFPTIRHLKVKGDKIDDRQLVSAAKLFTGLETLELVNAKITNASIPSLARLKTLKQLKLVRTKVEQKSLGELQSLLPDCHIEITNRE